MKNACLIALSVSGVLAGGYVFAQGAPASSEQARTERLASMEDAQEKANKQVVNDWQDLLAEGKAKEAFEKYVSPKFVDYAHLVQKKDGKPGGYREALAMFSRMPAGNANAFKAQAIRANGDHVTVFGGLGVDIFAVHNGRITAHWDASPDKAVSLPAPGR